MARDAEPSQRAAQARSRSAVGALLAANLIPLVGVLALGWSVLPVVALYWAENAVVGGFNLARMAAAGGAKGIASKIFLMPFFVVHYGIFWAVHGIFVFAIFGEGGFDSNPSLDVTRQLEPDVIIELSLALAGFAISHGISFWRNYIKRGIYLRTDPQKEMMAPYRRVVVLHVTVIAAAFVLLWLNAPTLALVPMVLLKTGLDLQAHLAAQRRASA